MRQAGAEVLEVRDFLFERTLEDRPSEDRWSLTGDLLTMDLYSVLGAQGIGPHPSARL